MTDIIYVEDDIRDHPRTVAILARYPQAEIVACDRYQAVFNRRDQNFRLQKRRPSLILARKHEGHVLAAPAGYGIGGTRNFYFSHMYNCVFDCQYCFLQGMFQSAHYVVFVNFEDFARAIATEHRRGNGEPTYFYSGYDCDSLAFDATTGFVDAFLPTFADLPGAWLELRTKSVAVSRLLARPAMDNVVVAFSLGPSELSEGVEVGVPSVDRRLEAARRLAAAGWPIGLRFDPVLYDPAYVELYNRLFERVFAVIPAERVHSVSIGPLRFPKAMFDTIWRQQPQGRVLSGPLTRRGNMMSYAPQLEQQMHRFCVDAVSQYMPPERLFACLPPEWAG
ncbi:MAG: DNA photolyase [Myxococcales bacterium FL481]|nr:MAG: DNA photolyase [Myxococcales bacterium FL481]